MVKQISCVTSGCGNRCKALSRTRLVNIILLVAEIIPDNWHCFSFWHQVFFSMIFLVFAALFSMLLPATHSMCRGMICFSTLIKNQCVWWIAAHAESACTVCVRYLLKLAEFICLLHCKLCDVTVAHMYISNDLLYRAALLQMIMIYVKHIMCAHLLYKRRTWT